MGCCNSKQQQQKDLYIDVPRDVSTTDKWVLREKSFVGGCKLLPFTAASPASYPYQALTRVVLGEDHVFAALWEGQGGAQAARHCAAACYETLLQCLQSNSDPCWALRQTTRLLDESYLASDLPDLVKAGVGATGLMMYLNTRSNHCYIGRMGTAQPFVAAAQGSFNTISIAVRMLSEPPSQNHPAASPSGSYSQQARSTGGAQRCASPSTAAAADELPPAHAVGLGFAKTKKLQDLWLQQQLESTTLRQQLQQRQLPFISDECEVSMTQLAAGDETIVLAGEGLMQVMAPQEVGMLLHHFNADRLNELKQAFTAAAPQQEDRTTPSPAAPGKAVAKRGIGRGGSSGGGDKPETSAAQDAVAAAGKLSRHTNVANVVIHRALSKALEQHNTQQARQQGQAGPGLLTYEQLMRLPLVIDTEAFRPAGAAGAGVRLLLPDHCPAGSLSKRDVHGDMGLVVICLSRPGGSDGGLAPGLVPRPGRAPSRPDAQYRWQLLRLAVKCRVAYKRSLRRRWWQLVDDAGVAAEAAARQAEVQAWRDRGAAVKVNLHGSVHRPDEAIRTKHSPAHKLAAAAAAAATAQAASATRQCPGKHASPAASPASAAQQAAAAAASRSPASHGACHGSPSHEAAAAAAGKLGLRSSSNGSHKAEVTPAPNLSHSSSSSSGGGGRGRKPGPVVVTPLAAAIGSAGSSTAQPDPQDTTCDIESPTKLDSPSKAAAAAAAAAAHGSHKATGWASSPRKKGGAATSPTKPAHGNLSLRSGRSTADGSHSPAKLLAAEPSWPAMGTISCSRDGAATPPLLAKANNYRPAGLIGAGRGGAAGELTGGGGGAPVAGPSSSPAKGACSSPTKAGGSSGAHGLRGTALGSPSKKISLRPSRPAAYC